MSADVIAQLEAAAQVLDRLAGPVAFDEVQLAAERDGVRWRRRRAELDVESASYHADGRPRRTGRRPILVAAAAVLVVIGGLVLVTRRGPDERGPAGPNVDTTIPITPHPVSTVDPLAGLVELDPGAFPDDVVLRYTAALGANGQVWVYDSASRSQVCFVRHLDDTKSFGCVDQTTYTSGQGWSFESNHGSALLWGFTSPSNPVVVSVDSETVGSDENGLWYTVPAAEVTAFTITTADGVETTYDLAGPVATTDPLPASVDTGSGSAVTAGLPDCFPSMTWPPAENPTTATTVPKVPGVDCEDDAQEQHYVVQPGDSAYLIADIFGVEPSVLVNYNAWPDGIEHLLEIGEVVKIPPGYVPPVPTFAAPSSELGSDGTDQSP